MKNSFKTKTRAFRRGLGTIVFALMSVSPAVAQIIEQGQLDAPTSYSAGVLNAGNGGLDSDLWQSTSAEIATTLISKAPIESNDPLIKDMLRAVLLSSAVPPQGTNEALGAYETAKLTAIASIAEPEALQLLIERSGASARTPKLQAEFALRKKDIETACGLSDTITEGRSDIFWSRLRTLCHLQRGELAAAELTADLLRSKGYDDMQYFQLVRALSGVSNNLPTAKSLTDPINAILYDLAAVKLNAARPGQAFDVNAPPELRLAALLKFSDVLTQDQIIQGFSELAIDPDNILASSILDFGRAEADLSSRGTAQLFLLSRAKGNPDLAVRAFSSLLKRIAEPAARRHLFLIVKDSVPNWSPDVMVASDLAFYASMAVQDEDIALLQSLYRASYDDFHKARIALAADALGNGFLLEPMGRDIDRRLAMPDNKHAKRDALLALSLGAIMSDTALQVLPNTDFEQRTVISEGDRAVLKANAKAGQTAQLLLRLATLLAYEDSIDTPSLALAVTTLQEAGLSSYAGRLAARDFLSPIQK